MPRLKVFSIIVCTLFLLQILVLQPRVFAIADPGNYPVDANAIVVPTTLEGSSTNDHTMPTLLWSNGDTVYSAVKSTHRLEYMTLNGVKTTEFDEYNPWVNIHVDNIQYEPAGLTGNTNDSHWTVFKFRLADLNLVGYERVPFFIKGIGRGHDVGGNLVLTIPRIDMTGNKVWVGGTTRSPITLQLKAQVNNEPQKVIASGVVNGTENPAWTYKWESVPQYDPYGRLYNSFSIDEEAVPPNYIKSLDGLTVTNTYKPAQINIEVNKVWMGPTKESVTVKLFANGEYTGRALELNGTKGWSGSFTVNQYDDSGKEISYTVIEAEVPYGYEVSYQTGENGRFIVTNTALEGGDVTAKYVDEEGIEIADPVVYNGYVGETYRTEQKEIPGYEFKELRHDSVPAAGEFKIEPQTVIYVYKQKMGSLTLTKVDAGQPDKVLEGAVFELYDSENNLIGTKTTDSKGQIIFDGLDWGEYSLVETKAPAGYRMLTEKISVEISKAELHQTKTVENTQVGWEIPRTGGIGTIGFYGLGGLLMGSALLWFVLGRRHP